MRWIDEPDSVALKYLYDNLRRTFMGKNYPRGGRWTNQKRAMLRIYFSPGKNLNRAGFANPAAAFNKLMSLLGIEQLGLGGKIDGVIEAAIGRWIDDVLSGRYLGQDTIDEVFGRKDFGAK